MKRHKYMWPNKRTDLIDREIDDIKREMFEIFIQYSENLLNGPEPDQLKNEDEILDVIPSKAVPIGIEFTRKYFGVSIHNLPG